MTNQTNNTENQEINLTHVSKKVKGYFSSVNDSFFDGILFIKRNSIALAMVVIAGAAYGFYADITGYKYQTKVFLAPNFNSTDYLYNQVKNLSSKMHNPEFRKKTGINADKKLSGLKIEPVIDIYNFIDDPAKEIDENDRNYQLFKLISENGDMSKMLKDEVTSKNYKLHTLTITTKKVISENDIKPIMDFLNANPYYKTLQTEYIKNLDVKIAANDTLIKQIDGILNSTAKAGGSGANLVLNDNASLDEVIKQKNKLVKEQGRNKIDKVNFNKIINDTSAVFNGGDDSFLNGKMKFVMPILFLLLFVVAARFKNYYKSQVNKRQIVITEA
ncbi:hypothetical protein R1T16_04805 [Flavobacterium sp. DG1-102-2]|uniref:hypothetical protein n=1 Tax=Flavobacterium sp. DG1-102-2 TaxID=3081663 RepID=UPI002948F73B|nr:hypothetical protein [Flavobacterium sp. DG1-102-2]MDV6167733.1 hypothetical protein [Flavobacterium sp. DG1-102-2]